MVERLRYYLNANGIVDGVQIEKILSCFKPKTVERNTVLLSAGETCKELYFVHSGCIRTFYITKEGHEKTRYLAFENAVATSISSFISQQPSFECVDALEDVTLYAIQQHDFFRLVSEIPEWEKYYRTLLETAYIYQNKKIEHLVTLSAKQRYERLLKENPKYVQRLSNRVIASYLDIREETLSRLKSK